jgi:hypothetical protein
VPCCYNLLYPFYHIDLLCIFVVTSKKLTPWSRVLLETLIACPASQEISRVLWNPKVHYCVHKSLPPILTLSQVNPIHTPKSVFLRSNLILSSHLCPDLQNGLFPSGFPIKTLYALLPHGRHMPYPSHLIRALKYLMKSKLQSTSLCSCLHIFITLSFLVPYSSQSTLFSNTFSLRSLCYMRDQLSHLYKTIAFILLYILIFTFVETRKKLVIFNIFEQKYF